MTEQPDPPQKPKTSPFVIIGIATAVLLVGLPLIVMLIAGLSYILLGESSPILPFIYTII